MKRKPKDIHEFLTDEEIKNGFPAFNKEIQKVNEMRIKILESQIEGVIEQLDKWQRESLTGGWSTHQVIPMQRAANRLRMMLNKKEKNYEAKKSNSIIENL